MAKRSIPAVMVCVGTANNTAGAKIMNDSILVLLDLTVDHTVDHCILIDYLKCFAPI